MDEIQRLERNIARLKKGMSLRRVVCASYIAALLSVYGYFLLVRALPLLVRAVYVAW